LSELEMIGIATVSPLYVTVGSTESLNIVLEQSITSKNQL